MPINFNVAPYFDDFDPNDNFHRILFKPGFAIQARELTQAQTIQQDQITKFADNIFKQNTPVTGGQVTTNLHCNYIKIQPTISGANIDISIFDKKLIQDATGTIVARVITVSESTGVDGTGDPHTLIVSYLSGTHFPDNAIIYDSLSNASIQAYPTAATGVSSVVSISQGVFYIASTYERTDGTNISNGVFVQVNPQTIILNKYSNIPSNRVGLNIVETINDYIDDSALLDPAIGASNFQAPGADRYKIILNLESRSLDFGDDDGFIELVRIDSGKIIKMVDGSVYNVIDDYMAKRTYETNGDYIVSDFKLTPKANTDTSLFDINIGKGTAFVRGYRVENQSETSLTTTRARTTNSINNNATFVEYGNYFYINTLAGVFDVTSIAPIDLHCVSLANIATTNTTTYNSTVVGKAYIRDLDFDHYVTVDDTTSYIYKASVTDIQNKVISGNCSATGTSTTIYLPNSAKTSAIANAYYGVTLSIDAGPSAGDVKRIVSYSGATRIATVDTPFTVTPTTSSVVTLRFGIKDIETIANTAYGTTTINASAAIPTSVRSNGLSTGDTSLQNIVSSELLYSLGTPYISTISDASYQATQTFRSVPFQVSAGKTIASLNFNSIDPITGDIQFLGTSHDNYIVINNTTGALVSFANTSIRHITLSNNSNTAVFTCDDIASAFNATVIVKSSISNASSDNIKKIKNLKTANTANVFLSGTAVGSYVNVDLTNGQTYIKTLGLVTPGQPQSLYVSDVKKIIKIIDTQASATVPVKSMLTNSVYDVTNNFAFDNGQRDSWYQHASIKLIPGRPAPKGQLLVLFDYYEHVVGGGYFSIESYLAPHSAFPEAYGQIPSYVAKNGMTYSLRDSLDFRPSQKNAQSLFVFNFSGTDGGVMIPTDNSIFRSDYSYYLGRKDRIILTKDKNFQIINGTPATTPTAPAIPDGSLVIANLTLDPYTSYITGEAPAGVMSNLSVESVSHKRWTMDDISALQGRINNIEYYTSLSNLENSAQGMQIPDVNGLNRFKNGILTDDFSSFATADTYNTEFNVSINGRTKILTASQQVDNFPLHSSYLNDSMGRLSLDSANTLGFKVNTIGKTNIFTLPYSSTILAKQTLASNTINVNPYATPIFEGVMDLNPPMDNWVDNTKQPDLLIVDPNITLYQSSTTLNTLSVGDWKTIPGSESTSKTQSSVSVVNHGAFNGPFGSQVGYTQTTTQTYNTSAQSKTTISGYYDSLGSNYSQQGGYITDVSVLPYIRAQQILFRAKGLAINTSVSAWFDGVKVDNYITNPDIVELTGVTGTFQPDDVIGYHQSSVFYPIATVVYTYVYPGTAKVRLYIVGNFHTSYVGDLPINTITNARFNSSGVYQSYTASGVISGGIVTVHKTGYVSTVGGTFVDGANNSVKYYRVMVNHGSFADKYGIWGSPKATGNLPAGKFNFTVPTTGTYTMRVSTDDAQVGYITINGTSKWTTSLQSGSYNDISLGTLTAGTNYITFSMTTTDDDGDAYMAVAIFPTGNTSNVIFGTDLLHLYVPTIPTTAGTITALPGGGLYFVGVTELSLSGLASDKTNFYVGSKININTQYIDVNPYSGVVTVLPTNYTATVLTYNALSATVTLNTPVNISLGTNSIVGGDITSFYSMDGTHTNYNLAAIAGGLETLSTDESGNFVGIFNIPPSTFKTGDRVFKIDNRTVDSDPASATTYAAATFTASGLSTKSQSINFSPSISAAKNTFTQTKYKDTSSASTQVTYAPYDPVAQSFIVDSTTCPNGTFLKSIRVFFKNIDTTNVPITLSIVGTQNGYPNGETLDNSIVTLFPNQIKYSDTPQYLDSNTYTEFEFPAPVYILPGVLYAFILKSVSTSYNVWIAAKGGTAVSSSVKNLPADPTPTVITKIGNVPYVGSMFESQNAMTWTADQGKALMFVLNRCKFDTTKTPKIPFVVARNLPYRKLTSQDIQSYYNANNISNIFGSFSGKNVLSDAYNFTTTDFTPTPSIINYSFKSTLNDAIKTQTAEVNINPGKFACPTYDDFYLNDGKGERILIANSNSSFTMYSTLYSVDNNISPIISDDGVSLYNIRWNINNLELSNTTVTISDGGTGYSNATTTVSVSAPDDIYGTQAYASANIVGGIIKSIDFINTGSGYQSNPIITISDASTRSGNSNASVIVYGETSQSGGNGISKYFTKKVVLSAGNDSGDLRVFYTAYRPYGTKISVYYKILNRNDTQTFEDSSWQLMTTIGNSNTFSSTRDDVYEFEVAPGINNVANNAISYTSNNGINYTSFSQFAIKVVLSTNDKTNVPFLTDIRAIALPSGTGM